MTLALTLAPAVGQAVGSDLWGGSQSQPVAQVQSQPVAQVQAQAMAMAMDEETLARQDVERLTARFDEMVRTSTLKRLDGLIKVSGSAKERKVLTERRERLQGVDVDYLAYVRQDVFAMARRYNADLSESQFLLYVDRNPAKQLALVAFLHAPTATLTPIGFDLISTGNISRGEDYYDTPKGVFENIVDNFGYRALGTPNKDGWMGLGAKGSRVWDFGYHKSIKLYRDGTTMADMRLLIHSTDPNKGEKRLGRTDSKGCIRISQGLNAFLDLHSILDKNYEDWAKSRKSNWLLNKNRSPTLFPGRYLFVGDSNPSGEPRTVRQTVKAGSMTPPVN